MRWRPVATLADASRAAPWLGVAVGEAPVAIAGLAGDWFAVADACTHAGCAFSEDADLVDGVIVCNCHGSEFDLRTGAVVRGPAERPVRTYPVRVRGAWLEVEA
jgi:3-phenylpropionate/trans-cinnamate dioxygenase ferredoxin subunit